MVIGINFHKEKAGMMRIGRRIEFGKRHPVNAIY